MINWRIIGRALKKPKFYSEYTRLIKAQGILWTIDRFYSVNHLQTCYSRPPPSSNCHPIFLHCEAFLLPQSPSSIPPSTQQPILLEHHWISMFFSFWAERSRKDLFLPFSNFEHSISVLILSSVTPFPLYNYAMGPKYSVIFTQTYIPAPVSHWMTHTTNKQMSHPKNSTWCHNVMLKVNITDSDKKAPVRAKLKLLV